MKPIKQRRRNFMQERNLAIAEEVDMLLQAGFIKEVSKDRSPTHISKLNKIVNYCLNINETNNQPQINPRIFITK